MTNTPGTTPYPSIDDDDDDLWAIYADLEKSETAAQRKLEKADRRADRDRGI